MPADGICAGGSEDSRAWETDLARGWKQFLGVAIGRTVPMVYGRGGADVMSNRHGLSTANSSDEAVCYSISTPHYLRGY